MFMYYVILIITSGMLGHKRMPYHGRHNFTSFLLPSRGYSLMV